jgi:hypothetical protein
MSEEAMMQKEAVCGGPTDLRTNEQRLFGTSEGVLQLSTELRKNVKELVSALTWVGIVGGRKLLKWDEIEIWVENGREAAPTYNKSGNFSIYIVP